MPIAVASLIDDLRIALQDATGIRWSTPELVRYINRAQDDVHRARPDTTATVKAVALRAGFRQSLPAEAASLMDIPSNADGPSITKVDKPMLDAVEQNWRSRSPSGRIVHFMHDLRTPRIFEVYPPATSGARVDIEFSAYPTPAVAQQQGAYSDLAIASQWAPVIYHLALFYAWSKDAEHAGNAALATGHLARAEQMLGVDLQTTATVAPKE
ncbi:hypothetical protein LJR074_001968 [Acidovorax sp. LjRoot74]|uniref:phage adaptor protein n=1 Tax=Acidovorax sp. LjRoot74 TaxID=3342337 RepID=UPI003ECCB8B4